MATLKGQLSAWVKDLGREFTLGEAADKYIALGGSKRGPCESVLSAVSHMIRCVKRGPKGGCTTRFCVYKFDAEKLAQWEENERKHDENFARWEAENEARSLWNKIDW